MVMIGLDLDTRDTRAPAGGAEGHFSGANPRHLHQLVVMTTFTMDRKSTRGMLAAATEWVYWELILSDGHDWIRFGHTRHACASGGQELFRSLVQE